MFKKILLATVAVAGLAGAANAQTLTRESCQALRATVETRAQYGIAAATDAQDRATLQSCGSLAAGDLTNAPASANWASQPPAATAPPAVDAQAHADCLRYRYGILAGLHAGEQCTYPPQAYAPRPPQIMNCSGPVQGALANMMGAVCNWAPPQPVYQPAPLVGPQSCTYGNGLISCQ
jgi:hypothetical protein